MWNPDKAPVLGFERLARRHGVAKARRLWEAHKERYRLEHAKAAAQEKTWAEERARKGPIVRKDDWIKPAFHIAPITFQELHRSTLGERGCKGGEALGDEEYMRDFLKRHPECAPQKVVTGDIRSGWSAQLERAAVFGRCERALKHVQINQRLQAAAAQAPKIAA